ncbi:MAG: DUF2852 domain-containing protein [Maritimibacter sp.]|jgi:hypothetical protein
MTTAADPHTSTAGGWFSKAEGWLDAHGKGAWIAAAVLGFIFLWPIGLALLAYMIWSKRMFSNNCNGYGHNHRKFRHHMRSQARSFRSASRPSGNAAFDDYKAETLNRLMDEQEQFEAFLDRLRAAKDKQEFDQFMDERAETARDASAADDDSTDEKKD